MRPFETNLSLLERDLIARAAGRVFDAAEIDSPRPDNARTARSRPRGRPTYPRDREAPWRARSGPRSRNAGLAPKVPHHISTRHLNRYLREPEFHWDRRKASDGERTVDAIRGAKGKRLMYHQPREAAHA